MEEGKEEGKEQNIALGIDARSGDALDELESILDRMKAAGYDYDAIQKRVNQIL